MKVLRKRGSEDWGEAIYARAREGGYSEAEASEVADVFYDKKYAVGTEDRTAQVVADAAWDTAEEFGLLETIEAADPGPDADLCLHCLGAKSKRNPTGECDHLYWPDYLSAEAKQANGCEARA